MSRLSHKCGARSRSPNYNIYCAGLYLYIYLSAKIEVFPKLPRPTVALRIAHPFAIRLWLPQLVSLCESPPAKVVCIVIKSGKNVRKTPQMASKGVYCRELSRFAREPPPTPTAGPRPGY